METEYEDDDEWEEQCLHGKWDSEECPECDAYYAAHPDETDDDADSENGADEPVNEG